MKGTVCFYISGFAAVKMDTDDVVWEEKKGISKPAFSKTNI